MPLTFSRRNARFIIAGESECANRISGHAVDLGCSIHMIDAEGAAQIAISDLSGGGCLPGTGGGESKYAAGAHRKNAADDPLLAHAQTDQPVVVPVLFQELRHGYVVVQAGGGGDEFVVLGRNLHHAGEGLIQLLGRFEVVDTRG